MRLVVHDDPAAASIAAAGAAATRLREVLGSNERARLVAATGSSQLRFLAALLAEPELDWARVELFHLDEYVGLGEDHPASFARYMRERLVEPTGIGVAHLIDGTADPATEVAAVGAALATAPTDLLFLGVGENGHLAFNDPPADVITDDPYLIVDLDERCRSQQVGEGWFAAVDDVPSRAISMSMRQILRAEEIIGVVTDERKADAVAACFAGEISPMLPASYLRTHGAATIFLDRDAVSRLDPAVLDHYR
jgi:glucosamine-6-phosphate deaminase